MIKGKISPFNQKSRNATMETMKIGYIAISKASWMTPKIDAIAKRTFENLQTLPAEILYHGVTTTEGEAAARAEEFARAGVDTVVMHFVTFPVGATIPAAATRLDVPFVLLANPEEPGPGKMWEQNSFCGANMAAHGLNRLRKRYCFVMARPEETAEALKKPLAVVRAVKMLRNLRIGLAGGRVPGFYTSNFDELLLRREFGVAVEVLDLLEIVKTADTLTEAELAAARKVVKESAAKVNAVSAADLELAATMYGSFRKTAEKYQHKGKLKVIISVPGGEETARRTFNPRLGIQGGISILGTSGIVEPMSEAALIESIRVEMAQKAAEGMEYLLVTPGNYGADYLKEHMDLPFEKNIKCSNYVGETIDMAVNMGIKGILFVSHIGKFVKVAAGIMNTHSHNADARMETLCACAIRAGAGLDCAKEILDCGTTDEALAVLKRYGVLKESMGQMMLKIQFYLDHRSYEQILLGAVIFSNEYGYLGQTENAGRLIGKLKGN